MNTLLEFSSLGDALRDLVERRKHFDRKFSFGALADQCGIQRSYLSQAIHKKARLNADQMYSIAAQLELNDEESHYLCLLNEIETTAIKERRKKLERERQTLQSKALQTENKIKRSTIENKGELSSRYYSNCAIPLLHMFLTIPQYSRKHETIRIKLGLDEDLFRNSLGVLEGLGLVALKKNFIEVLEDKLHLSSASHLSSLNAISFRQKAIEYLLKTKSPENHHFTASFSGTRETRLRVKTLFLKFIEEAAQEIEGATPEEVYQINFDLFQI